MMTRELAAEFKKACEEQDCATCPFSVGIYMEGPEFTYYSCDIRKKPRDYDIDKLRMKQNNKKKDVSAKLEKEKTKKKRGRKKKETK